MRIALMLVTVFALMLSPWRADAESPYDSGIPGIAKSPTTVETVVYAAVERFEWKEYDLGGSRLLKETGPRYGLGIARRYLRESFTFRPKAEVYAGKVDYDGQTQDGIPATTTTTYTGYKLEADVGGVLRPAKGYFVEPFLGLGYNYWKRDLEDKNVVYGGTEEWDTLYVRTGVRVERRPDPSAIGLFGVLGIRWPVYNKNHVNIRGVWDNVWVDADATLKPGREQSCFAEFGAMRHPIVASAYYEGMRFKKSPDVVFPLDETHVLHVWQPRSSADIFGARVGYQF